MALSRSSLSNIPTCFASCSIGCKPSHTLPKKLEAIAAAGFSAIELSFPDILAFGSQHLSKDIDPYDYDTLCVVGEEIRKLCQDNGLRILILQPFSNFEGWPKGSKEREDAFTRAKGWIRIMQAVGTNMLQVGSTDSPTLKPSQEEVAADLSELADLLAPHGFRIAYENWCWSSHAPTWLDVWQIVEKVNKPNVGLCLDTFQTAGSEWADPTTLSGLLEDETEHLGGRELLSVIFHESLENLSKTVPKEKIYFLQISDAYKPKQPFENKSIDGLRPRGRWSHDFRPVPFDGGYLPVVDVAKAVLKTGFRGYFSMEVFDGGPDGKGKEYELDDFAKEAMESHKKLLDACAEA